MADEQPTRVDALADLPPLPPGQRGESNAAGGDGDGDGAWTVSVANAGESSGYLCSVRATASFPRLHPGALYAIFTHPRNDGVFSGIKRVAYRNVLEEEPAPGGAPGGTPAQAAVAFRRVEVEQVGELRILMVRREFATRLVVEEDARHASEGRYETRFTLVRSDALSRFEGAWHIERGGADDAAATTTTTTTSAGCRVRLEQQVLPRGVPVFMQRVPLVGALLRRVSLAAVEQLMRDLQKVAAELRKSHPSAAACGNEREVHAALDALKRERRLAAQLDGGDGGRGGAAVASFAPGGGSEGSEDDDDRDGDGDER